LRILHVNQTDSYGGAAKAALRLHEGLLNHGIDSSMFVLDKYTSSSSIRSLNGFVQNKLKPYFPKFDRLKSIRYLNREELFSSGYSPFSGVIDEINKLNPDIVHLHWINGGMIGLSDLKRINARVFWSLHDMWPFTGGCHYTLHCDNHKTGCGNCRVLKSGVKNDLSRNLATKKNDIYNEFDPIFIGLSKWIYNEISNSYIGSNRRIIHVPNLIDIRLYRPMQKSIARDTLNLCVNKKYILFGAMNATSDSRKGFQFIEKMMLKLDDMHELLVFGAKDGPQIGGKRTHYLGVISEEKKLRTIYCAADVFLSPSTQENLSNAIMESMACGTPVVGFNIGGNSDMIDHLINGYLAEPFNVSELMKGVRWCIEKELSLKASQKISATFAESVILPQYIESYEKVLREN
jgi:glycosyltransferase involved in cell wall biosynthesis